MPRTKVSKTSKRNREAENREEIVRQCEVHLGVFENSIEEKIQSFIEQWDAGMACLEQRMKGGLLEMKMSDIYKLNLETFSSGATEQSVPIEPSQLESVSRIKTYDEGYLTEESCGSNVKSNIKNNERVPSAQKRIRTPGPLSSAFSRNIRRSRSACNDDCITRVTRTANKNRGTSAMSKQSDNNSDTINSTDRQPRSKFRTPHRSKAHSADRTHNMNEGYISPPATLMRWPKPGELIISTSGTPVVAQSFSITENYANLNIPVKDGVLSLRPKNLGELRTDMIKGIKIETINQLKTLTSSINAIVNLAEQQLAGLTVAETAKKQETKNKNIYKKIK